MPPPGLNGLDERTIGIGPPPRTGTSGVSAPKTRFATGVQFESVLGTLGTIVGTAIGGPVGGALGGALGEAFAPGDNLPARQCPGGTVFDPQRGCIFPGSPGEISVRDVTDVGVLQDVSFGVFGLLSAQPMVVGEIRGNPVLRCPHPGLVLGKDDRCYSKKDLPRTLRKWPPHKCSSAVDKKLKTIKAAGSAAKSLQTTFKGSGYKISKTGK